MPKFGGDNPVGFGVQNSLKKSNDDLLGTTPGATNSDKIHQGTTESDVGFASFGNPKVQEIKTPPPIQESEKPIPDNSQAKFGAKFGTSTGDTKTSPKQNTEFGQKFEHSKPSQVSNQSGISLRNSGEEESLTPRDKPISEVTSKFPTGPTQDISNQPKKVFGSIGSEHKPVGFGEKPLGFGASTVKPSGSFGSFAFPSFPSTSNTPFSVPTWEDSIPRDSNLDKKPIAFTGNEGAFKSFATVTDSGSNNFFSINNRTGEDGAIDDSSPLGSESTAPTMEKPENIFTGEENETTLFEGNTKLYRFNEKWESLAVGKIKVNKFKNENKYRIILRTDGILKLMLNASVFAGMNPKILNQGDSVSFIAQNLCNPGESLSSFSARFKTGEDAANFCNEITRSINSLAV